MHSNPPVDDTDFWNGVDRFDGVGTDDLDRSQFLDSTSQLGETFNFDPLPADFEANEWDLVEDADEDSDAAGSESSIESEASVAFHLVDALSATFATYDERLYYTAKEYHAHHALYHKQHQRGAEASALPLRYRLLLLWHSPLSTHTGVAYLAFQGLISTASILQLVWESAPRYNPMVKPELGPFWQRVELPISSLFALDILVHFCLLPPVPNEYSLFSRRSFFKKYQTWLDIVTIIPTILSFAEAYVPWARNLDALKALRVLRFTQVLRQLNTVDQLAYTLEQCFDALVGPFGVLLGLLVALSSALYFVERGEYDSSVGQFLIRDCNCLDSPVRVLDPSFPCPPLVSKFVSIPHAMWFTLVTITTVGYGDIVPVCPAGRFLAAATAVFAIVLVAMPIAIVGTYYSNIVMANRGRKVTSATTPQTTTAATNGAGGGETQPGTAGDNISGARYQAARAKSAQKRCRHARRELLSDDSSTQDAKGGGDHALQRPLLHRRSGDRPRHTRAAPGGAAAAPHEQLGGAVPAVGTPGQRLARFLAGITAPIDLLDPPAAVLHAVADCLRREAAEACAPLRSRQGVRATRARAEAAAAAVSLELTSGPVAAALPSSVALARPLVYTVTRAPTAAAGGFGAAFAPPPAAAATAVPAPASDGGGWACSGGPQAMAGHRRFHHSAPSASAAGGVPALGVAATPLQAGECAAARAHRRLSSLPQRLFHVAVCPVRHAAILTPVFPSRVAVNDVTVPFGSCARLCVGDTVAVMGVSRAAMVGVAAALAGAGFGGAAATAAATTPAPGPSAVAAAFAAGQRQRRRTMRRRLEFDVGAAVSSSDNPSGGNPGVVDGGALMEPLLLYQYTRVEGVRPTLAAAAAAAAPPRDGPPAQMPSESRQPTVASGVAHAAVAHAAVAHAAVAPPQPSPSLALVPPDLQVQRSLEVAPTSTPAPFAAAGHIRVRPADPPPEYRSLQFSAYAPTFANLGHVGPGDFDDI